MNRTLIGILVGAIAGIIDVIPMALQKLSWDANLSAFSLWVVVGFLVSVVDLKLPAILKGLLIAILVATPVVIIVAAQDPASLIPIGVMTVILGSGVGLAVEKFGK